MQRPAVIHTSEQLRPRPNGGLWKDVGGSWKTLTVRASTGVTKPEGVKLAKIERSTITQITGREKVIVKQLIDSADSYHALAGP